MLLTRLNVFISGTYFMFIFNVAKQQKQNILGINRFTAFKSLLKKIEEERKDEFRMQNYETRAQQQIRKKICRKKFNI